MTQINYDNGSYLTYQYDPVGNLIQITSHSTTIDTDGDGLPDSWEIANNLDPNNGSDALIDVDGDGFTNLEEYEAGSDPQDDQSFPDVLNPALDTGNYQWTLSGDVPWFAQNATYHVGISALQSGAINNNEQSSIETIVNGASSVSFYWKVSSESGADTLAFYVDEVQVASISGAIDWQQKRFNLSPGNHVIRWTYSKNGASFDGSDAGWLDGVSINSGFLVPILYLLQ